MTPMTPPKTEEEERDTVLSPPEPETNILMYVWCSPANLAQTRVSTNKSICFGLVHWQRDLTFGVHQQIFPKKCKQLFLQRA
jgi:hypothetical protein